MIEQEAAVIVLDKLFNESPQLAMDGNQAGRVTRLAFRHFEAPNPSTVLILSTCSEQISLSRIPVYIPTNATAFIS